MKELEPQRQSYVPEGTYYNYGYDYDEPLLEYVAIIAEYYHPPTSEDKEYGRYISTAIDDFIYRYLDNRADKRSMQKYLENTEVQQTIEAMGYDLDMFWYLLIFIYDYSAGYCKKGIKSNETPQKQIEKLIKGIVNNISSFEEYSGDPIFTKPAQLVLKIPRKNITIDNPIALTWLAGILKDELEKIENGSKMATSVTRLEVENGEFKYKKLNDSKHIWYFSKMFLSFFELKPPEITQTKKELKANQISVNKHLLITRLLYCVGLLTAKENRQGIREENDAEDTINGFLKQYKNYKLDMINGYYL